MARIRLSLEAIEDIERCEAFLEEAGDPLAGELAAFIVDALHVLSHQPGIGRPVELGMRELIISRGRSGYLALYRLDGNKGIVRVLRLRHQRESGYADGDI